MNPSNLFEHLRQPFPLEKSNLHSDNCQVLQVNSSTTSLSSSEFPKNDSSQDFWGVEIRFSQRKSANKAKKESGDAATQIYGWKKIQPTCPLFCSFGWRGPLLLPSWIFENRFSKYISNQHELKQKYAMNRISIIITVSLATMSPKASLNMLLMSTWSWQGIRCKVQDRQHQPCPRCSAPECGVRSALIQDLELFVEEGRKSA